MSYHVYYVKFIYSEKATNIWTLFSGVLKNLENIPRFLWPQSTDYGHPMRKSPSLPGRKSNPNPKFISRYGRSIFCLPHWPKILGFFDLFLHWVSGGRGEIQTSSNSGMWDSLRLFEEPFFESDIICSHEMVWYDAPTKVWPRRKKTGE